MDREDRFWGTPKRKRVLWALVSVTIVVVFISLCSWDPPPGDFGLIKAGSITHKGDVFKVTNPEEVPVQVLIRASNMEPGGWLRGKTWNLDTSPSPSQDTFRLTAVSKEGTRLPLSSSPTLLVERLEVGETQSWDLEFIAPTSFSDGMRRQASIFLTYEKLEEAK